MPGIDASAEHDDFVVQVRAGNFADDVVSHGIVVIEARGDVHFEANGNPALNEAHHAVVLLGGDD
jgi:hypothetical protein